MQHYMEHTQTIHTPVVHHTGALHSAYEVSVPVFASHAPTVQVPGQVQELAEKINPEAKHASIDERLETIHVPNSVLYM